MKRIGYFIFFVVFLLNAGCQISDEPVYTVISQPTLAAGDPIPLPAEEVTFTITGKIGTSNDGEQIIMDVPTVESLGLVNYTVQDPFKDESVTYTGVLMSDLLALWQIEDDATQLSLTALNDYQVDVPLNLLQDYPVVFALKADGSYMPIAERGPAMLVFPYDHFEFEQPLTNSYWIWQIASLNVE